MDKSVITVESDCDEDRRYATSWDETEWINCSKKYIDIPNIVTVARRHVLAIPTKIHHTITTENPPHSRPAEFKHPAP